MSSCPAGLQRLSFDVIEPAFSRRLPPVAAHLDIGAAVRKLSRLRCCLCLKSRPHPEPLAGRKIGNQSEPWLPPACCAAAIPEPGSASSRLRAV